ncbi:MAG: glutamate racemase [Thermodesulfobacteriota bacterium]
MIGIFDSGIGGVTVARAVRKALPDHDLLYYGDTARSPYGTKSIDTIRDYALQNIRFLLDEGADIIVAACNSASSAALEVMTGRYKTPVFEVVTPAVGAALQATRTGRIGVIGTRATIGSGIYETRLRKADPEVRVHSAPCPLLVPLVEEGWLKKPETTMIVKKYLHPLKVRQIDTLILGCTHYPVLKETIGRKIGKRVRLIDASAAVAAAVKSFLKDHPDLDQKMRKDGSDRFVVSDSTPQFEKTARAILKRPVRLETVRH